jgi:hypothetical protein
MRGVKKGALTTEQAMEKLTAFIDAKEKSASTRAEKTKTAKAAYYVAVNGIPKKAKVKEVPAAEAPAEETSAE